jgi:hypothetical protein
MGALPTHEQRDRAEGSPPPASGSDPGVWLTDRDPGELATALAEQILEAVERAAAAGRWAEIGDRLVRPEAILSVDIEHAE